MLIVYKTQWNGYKRFREENHSFQELTKVLRIINNVFLTTVLQLWDFESKLQLITELTLRKHSQYKEV